MSDAEQIWPKEKKAATGKLIDFADELVESLAADPDVNTDRLADLIDPLRANEQPPDRLPTTHISNAERLVAKFGEEICWTEDRGVWCAWREKFWCVNDEVGLSRRMQEVARQIYFEAAFAISKGMKASLWNWAQRSESHGTQTSSIDEARCRVAVRFCDRFDRHPAFLNFSNVTYDLETGKSHAHRREDFITKLVDVPLLPDAQCPQFARFLTETFGGNARLIGYAGRVAGYCLSGITTEQAWWMFFGPTASGKSTFVKILTGLLGPYAITLPEGYFLLSRTESKDFVTATLQGARLATCIETADGRRLNVPRIKAISGEDRQSGELKYQNVFNFQPEAKLVLVTNFAPHVPASDDAIWRRLKVLPFSITVPEQKRIPGLAEKLLREEASGILNWALAGFRSWRTNGLQEPPEVTNAVKEYRRGEDTVQDFLTECYRLGRDCRALTADVYNAHRAWCEREGIHPLSKKKLGFELRRFGIARDDDHRHYLGLEANV